MPTVVDVVLAEMGTAGAILGTKFDAIAVGDQPADELSTSDLPPTTPIGCSSSPIVGHSTVGTTSP